MYQVILESVYLLYYSHKLEIKKTEAKALASEKLRRERWEAAKTKSLKVGTFECEFEFHHPTFILYAHCIDGGNLNRS